jgi:thioredoxin reductase
MELPELSFEETNVQDVKVKKNNGRVSGNEVRDYYQNYVKKKHLDKNMLNNATVVSVRKMKSFSMQNPTVKNDEDHDLWEVYGTISCANSNRGKSEKYEFRFVCKYLVLATGTTDINNELRVPGEHLSYVLSSTRELEEKIKKNLVKVRKNPVLVVGSGLSAADCILIANKYRIKIVHVMRTSCYDTSNIVYTKLPKNDYPDYHWVYEKMLESKKEQNMQTNDSIDSAVTNNNYVLYDEHAVKMFTSSHTCVLHSLGPVGNETEIKISYACVLIGHSANLNFLPCQIRNSLAIKACKPASKDNPINVDPYTLETIDCKNLFGMGPIIGDGFVRYGTAGALSVTSSIWKSKTHMV